MTLRKVDLKNRLEKRDLIALYVIITSFALVMRVCCCFWGWPLQLHADEPAVVDWAIEMLQRHSWEAHSYDRPDHFEIKCDSLLFTILSWIIYRKPAYEAFEEYRMFFYFAGRLFTTLFGTALVPLTGYLMNSITRSFSSKNRRIATLLTGILIAFSPCFVQHSAYATPDIVLTFFVELFTVFILKYIDSGKIRYIAICAVIIGIGITIKYPAALLCVPLALIVIYYNLFIEKGIKRIVPLGLLSIGIVFATILIIAPNLITEYQTVISNIQEEARPTHLGADGFDFWGNFLSYFKIISNYVGNVSVIPFLLGVISIIKEHKRQYSVFCVGIIYWICISCLSLHWLRWGIPFYPYYIILVVLGIVYALEWAETKLQAGIDIAISKTCIVCIYILSSLFTINSIISGLVIVKFSLLPDSRNYSQEYLQDNGINKCNSLFEGYTALNPGYSNLRVYSFFSVIDDELKINEKYALYEYYVMSDSFKNRYLFEPERYPEECEMYLRLDEEYDIVYKVVPNANYYFSPDVLENIVISTEYLAREGNCTGEVITVYSLMD